MLEASTETGEAPSGQNKFQDMLSEMKVVQNKRKILDRKVE